MKDEFLLENPFPWIKLNCENQNAIMEVVSCKLPDENL